MGGVINAPVDPSSTNRKADLSKRLTAAKKITHRQLALRFTHSSL